MEKSEKAKKLREQRKFGKKVGLCFHKFHMSYSDMSCLLIVSNVREFAKIDTKPESLCFAGLQRIHFLSWFEEST